MANDESEKKVRALVQSGSEIAGAAIGGAVGFLAAGPFGAAGAGALGVVITKYLAQIADKAMSARDDANRFDEALNSRTICRQVRSIRKIL